MFRGGPRHPFSSRSECGGSATTFLGARRVLWSRTPKKVVAEKPRFVNCPNARKRVPWTSAKNGDGGDGRLGGHARAGDGPSCVNFWRFSVTPRPRTRGFKPAVARVVNSTIASSHLSSPSDLAPASRPQADSGRDGQGDGPSGPWEALNRAHWHVLLSHGAAHRGRPNRWGRDQGD